MQFFIVAALIIVLALVAFLLLKKKKTTAPDNQLKNSESASAALRGDERPAEARIGQAGDTDAASRSDAGQTEKSGDESTGSMPDHIAAPAATVADGASESGIPSVGVRLDEAAETTAAINLKEARRERKLQKLRQGLAKTRGGLIDKISRLFKEKKEIDASLLNELEETLISADIGSGTAEWLIGILREALNKEELKSADAVWNLLKSEIRHALQIDAPEWNPKRDTPFTIMVVGVNGAGKTTTIGKLASQLTEQGMKVVLAAGDTFRAAAVNQLEIWGRRTGSEVIKPGKEGADPSSVVFEAVKHARETGADVVIADTAGRLHTQAPLMEELKKINRVMTKALETAPHEIILVLDATTGQNALQQAREFGEALPLTGLALTKLDGTAKGGVIVGICHERKIPVRFIGIGEAKDDLREFDPEDFVEALFLREE